MDVQDRGKLDAEVPDAACIHVLSGSRRPFYLSDGYVRARSVDPADRVLSAVEVLKRYGGRVLEDVLEAGLARVPG